MSDIKENTVATWKGLFKQMDKMPSGKSIYFETYTGKYELKKIKDSQNVKTTNEVSE